MLGLTAAAAYAVAPSLLAWMAPVVGCWVLALPVSVGTGWPALGRAVRRLGLLVTPGETAPQHSCGGPPPSRGTGPPGAPRWPSP